MTPTEELSDVVREKIVKLLKEGLSTRIVAKQVGCFQTAISKKWIKFKYTGIHLKEKLIGRPRKTSKRSDRKLKALCLQNHKHTSTVMKTKWTEAGINVCGKTVRNRLKEIEFSYRKTDLTTAQKKKRLQWTKNK